jgi:hypothetical protein
MKALTVRQPWAAAIAHHGKTVENRSWHTNFRGTLLIHAAKAAHPGISLIEYSQVRSAIVAVATLADCHPGDGKCTAWADHPEPSAWHWVLTDVRTLSEPVACKGALGLWTPAPEVVDAVLIQLNRPQLTLMPGGAS